MYRKEHVPEITYSLPKGSLLWYRTCEIKHSMGREGFRWKQAIVAVARSGENNKQAFDRSRLNWPVDLADDSTWTSKAMDTNLMLRAGQSHERCECLNTPR